jgi:chromatin assembly factor 1 subunit A
MLLNFHFVSTPMQVQVIRSCRDGINKVVESLQQRLPNVSKSQLKSKVREISDFVDNHWKVRVLSNS